MREFTFTSYSAAHRGEAKLVLICVICALCTFALLLSSCAEKQRRPAYKRLPEPASGEAPKEVIRPTFREAVGDVKTPERQASMRLVERGKGQLARDENELAAASFRDAVNVDPANGTAYYFLAEAHIKLGEADVAGGMLDKAEALLGHDPEWGEKISALREGLPAAESPENIPSPIDDSF